MSLVIASPKRRGYLHPSDAWLRDFFPFQPVRTGSSVSQKTNIIEFEDHYELEITAPGYSKEHLTINLDNNKLLIEANVEQEADKEGPNFRRREFSISTFSRTFELNDDVDQNGISAKLENGILKIKIQKKEEAKLLPKKTIEIS